MKRLVQTGWRVLIPLVGLLVPAGSLLTSGCKGEGASYQPVRLAPMANPYESDIPVPTGFRLVENTSEDRSTGTARLYLRHSYEGRAVKYDVRGFYREQMPLARWVKVSDGNVKGEYTMRFEKGKEVCTVVIRDRKRMAGGTEIQVIVLQEQRGAAPPKSKKLSAIGCQPSAGGCPAHC